MFSVNETINFETALALQGEGDRWIEEQKDIIVNFQSVDHCNSTGLAMMTPWMQHAKRLRKITHFINVPSTLQMITNVLLYGMEKMLEMKQSHG